MFENISLEIHKNPFPHYRTKKAIAQRHQPFAPTVCKITIYKYMKFVDSKTKCNVLVFKSSRFKEESVNFASWIKEEASSAEEQLDQAIDSCTTLK